MTHNKYRKKRRRNPREQMVESWISVLAMFLFFYLIGGVILRWWDPYGFPIYIVLFTAFGAIMRTVRYYTRDLQQCPYCGTKVFAYSPYCSNCGKPLIKVCPNCGTEVTSGKYCSNCGYNIYTVEPGKRETVSEIRDTEQSKSVCPSCGSEVDEGTLYCSFCGYKIGNIPD